MSEFVITEYFTAGAVAEAIRPGFADQSFREKIRTWTKAGYLPIVHLPCGRGTGRHNQYPVSSLYKARLLTALTDLGLKSAPANELLRDAVFDRNTNTVAIRSGHIQLIIDLGPFE